MKYQLLTIPHSKQRYNTPADYTTDAQSGVTTILVSELDHEDSEMAVALHELIESHLCHKAGISDDVIDAWDMAFDERSDADQYDEPGNHPEAPYHEQHMFALRIERLFIEQAGHDWDEHDARVLGIYE